MRQRAAASAASRASSRRSDSVFASREAAELERVLVAVAEPGQAPLVRAALATEMLGYDAAALDAAGDGRRRMGRPASRHSMSTTIDGTTRGFVCMLRDLLVRERVAARLLAYPDGERRMTNLLARGRASPGDRDAAARRDRRAASRGSPTPAARCGRPRSRTTSSCCASRATRRASRSSPCTRRRACEYPIVFCPFLWDGQLYAKKAERIVFHEEGNDSATLDVGAPGGELRRQQACEEELAERLRLLYVALTRARHRCYLVWGKVNEGGQSPLAWLLHPGRPSTSMGAIEARYDELSPDALRTEVAGLVARSGGTISIEALPAPPASTRAGTPTTGTETLAPRAVRRPVRAGYTIASFTALVADEAERERLDFDQVDEPASESAEMRLDAHGFPRGARAGRCLHALLEAIDFAAPDPAIIAAKLRAFGIEERWAPVVEEWLARILATPLDEGGGLRLARVPRERRVNELAFYYPVRSFEVAGLGDELARAGFGAGAFLNAAGRLPARAADGFLTGSIDCVLEHDGRYFVLDYKSNRLGDSLDAYAAPALVPAMVRGHYWLQYLIYVVAVHRWLRRRLTGYDYDRHMGGVRYLFLRGMDPARPGGGVYADQPSRAVIERLDVLLGGEAR